MDEDILSFFLDEARDVIETWDEAVIILKDGYNEDAFNQLFRAAHNLKGTSRSLDLLDFADYVHVVEDLMTDIKGDAGLFSLECVGLFENSYNYLRDWLNQLENDSGFKPGRLSEVMKEVTEFRNRVVGGEAVSQSDEQGEEVIPNESASEAQSSGIDDDLGYDPELLKEAMALGGGDGATTEVAEEPVPVVDIKENVAQTVKPSAGATPQVDQAKNAAKTRTIRVDLEKIDKITRDLGELTVYKEILMAGKRDNKLDSDLVRTAIDEMGRIISESNEDVLSVRVVPIGPLMTKLLRGCHELTSNVGKSIDFKTRGMEVELDKLIMEKIRDPLNHILRNSIDHGVESPDHRVQVGKPEKAVVSVSSWTEGMEVVVEVADDGKGLDKERILQKALEKGLISQNDDLTDEEIFAMILNPGFSTAEKVTEISGRGVGMDVVNTTIQNLGGRLVIQSKKGEGSSFQIRLPSNFNILDALVFEVSGEVFACPIEDIKEVIFLKELNVERFDDGTAVVRKDEQAIEIVSMKDILWPDDCGENFSHDVGIVLQSQGHTTIFTFDRVLHGQKVFVRPLEGKLKNRQEFIGTAVLSSGEPTLLINVSSIMETYYGTKFEAAS